MIGDLTDAGDRRARRVDGCDAIFHLAAMADVNQVVGDPVRTDRVNVRGTFNLLEAAREAEASSGFLYASTIWVYGNAPGPEPHDEDTPLVLPPHLYTATKLAGEMYCRSYESLYGVSTTILRFGIPYGPRARPAAVVPAFIAKAAGRRAAHDRRRRERRPASSSTSRTSPRGWSPRSLPQAPAGSTTSSATSSSACRQIADTVRELVADVPVEHGAGPARRPQVRPGLERARRGGARLARPRRASPTVSAATSTGSA